MGGRMSKKVVSKHGSIGKQIFEQVEQLTANGMKKLPAFKQISESTGRAVGTVAANYYRIARKKGAPLRARRRGPGRPPGRLPGTAKASSRIAAALEALVSAMKAQEEELTRLRRENARFAQVRRLLS